METLLMSVTLVSLAIAAVLAVLLIKTVRDERRRSEARIAALTAMADEPAAPVALVTSVGSVTPVASITPVASAAPAAPRARAAALPMRVKTEPRRTPPASIRATVDDLEIRPADGGAEVNGVAELFAPPEVSSPWGRRFAVIGAIAFVAGSALFFTMHQRPGRDAIAAAVPADTSGTATPAPLELVSLRHMQQGDTLTIAGLVQNPKSGTSMTRLTATAVVFGPDGAFLAGGKAPLDYTTLGAGDESPFVITVPVNRQVARYRVGFRAENGSVVAHVDRRADDAVARREP
jgi:hypothetical protein